MLKYLIILTFFIASCSTINRTVVTSVECDEAAKSEFLDECASEYITDSSTVGAIKYYRDRCYEDANEHFCKKILGVEYEDKSASFVKFIPCTECKNAKDKKLCNQ